MADAALPIPPPLSGEFDPALLADGQAAYADASDRLVRRMFGIGLRLHAVRSELDGPDGVAPGLVAARRVVTEVLDELDVVIREAGLAVVDLSREHTTPADEPGRDRR
ncbi:hypothetical protein [Nocardia sp. CC227C]|uniref:hypothetical protein n=1 Tax=Nocardia sp. CC227C TaxID=3044562 RepID=UPI00278C636D|nr:hypothetical protein [Nocardia sp. CC227C]